SCRPLPDLHSFPTRRSSDLARVAQLIGLPDDIVRRARGRVPKHVFAHELRRAKGEVLSLYDGTVTRSAPADPSDDHASDAVPSRSEEHTSELQSRENLVCRL